MLFYRLFFRISFFFFLMPRLSVAQEKAISPEILIKIPFKEAVIIDAIKVEFLEVLEDSRCPKGTTCVWEGQARVKLRITEKNKIPEEKEILLRGAKRQIIVTNKEGRLVVFKLTPHPSIKDKGALKYALLLKKEVF